MTILTTARERPADMEDTRVGAFNIPLEARLDPEIGRMLKAMEKGEAFDPSALARLVDPAVAEVNKAKMQAAQTWVSDNADCLECGVCCQQGWRVDVTASDIARMSPATLTSFVVTAPTSLRIIDGKCAAQTTHEGRGCGIYEERPEVCRTFPKGHERCVVARVERGLPIE
jgi:hypothetical protein